jgi:hypothetical protein
MTRKLYQALATLVLARANCIKSENEEWRDRHEERVLKLVAEYMPSGSGFDAGTKLDLDKSDANKLVFNTSFHHMTEHGYYDRWTEHTVIVRPSLAYGYELSISGPNRAQIKDYISEAFSNSLDIESSVYEEKPPEQEVRHA